MTIISSDGLHLEPELVRDTILGLISDRICLETFFAYRHKFVYRDISLYYSPHSTVLSGLHYVLPGPVATEFRLGGTHVA